MVEVSKTKFRKYLKTFWIAPKTLTLQLKTPSIWTIKLFLSFILHRNASNIIRNLCSHLLWKCYF